MLSIDQHFTFRKKLFQIAFYSFGEGFIYWRGVIYNLFLTFYTQPIAFNKCMSNLPSSLLLF